MIEEEEEVIDFAFSDYEAPCPNPAKHAFTAGWKGGYDEAVQSSYVELYDDGILIEWYTEHVDYGNHMNWDGVIEKMQQDHDNGLEVMEASLKKALSMVREKAKEEQLRQQAIDDADHGYSHLVDWAVTSYKRCRSWAKAHESMRDEALDMGLNLSLRATKNILDLAKLEWRKSK